METEEGTIASAIAQALRAARDRASSPRRLGRQDVFAARLARYLGRRYSKSQISRWEANGRATAEQLIAAALVASELGPAVSVEDLLRSATNPPPHLRRWLDRLAQSSLESSLAMRVAELERQMADLHLRFGLERPGALRPLDGILDANSQPE